MSEDFNVLKCFKCNMFQVHMTKKSKKWQCKLCGDKQSFTKIYGSGSAFDCRKHAQKLNMLIGQQELNKARSLLDNGDDGEDDERPKNINPDVSKAELNSNEIFQSTKKFRPDCHLSTCPNEDVQIEGPKTVFPSIHNTPITSKWFKYLDHNNDT